MNAPGRWQGLHGEGACAVAAAQRPDCDPLAAGQATVTPVAAPPAVAAPMIGMAAAATSAVARFAAMSSASSVPTGAEAGSSAPASFAPASSAPAISGPASSRPASSGLASSGLSDPALASSAAPSARLADVFAPHRRRLLATVALLALTLCAGAALLAVSGHFLTAAALALGGLAGGFNLFGPSAAIRGLTLVRIVSRYFEKVVGHDATLRIARDLRVWFFGRALPLAPARLGGLRAGDLLSRLLADIEAVDGALVRAGGPLAALAAMSAAAVACAAWLHPPAGAWLGASALALGVAVPLATVWGARRAEDARARAAADLRATALEGLEGACDLAALGAAGAWNARVATSAAAVAAADAHRRRRRLAGQGLHGLLAAVSLLGMVWIALAGAAAGAITAPVAAALVFLSVGMLEAWGAVGAACQAWQAARVSAARLQAVAATAAAVVDPARPQPLAPAPQPVVLEAVHFAHPGRAPILQGLDLRLLPGERVALRGDSGGGKSTLAGLLLRTLAPTAGRVCHGAQDLAEVAQADWHARVAWLPQEAPVFAGSVRHNLGLGAALDQVRAWTVLRALGLEAHVIAQGGLDAWIGEQGATWSAGQGRRLALARALLRPCELVVLDEPSEGLDHDTAQAMLRALPQLLDGRGLVLLTHAELPAGVVDRCYRLERGRLSPQ